MNIFFYVLFSSEDSLVLWSFIILLSASFLAESVEIWSRLRFERFNTICTELQIKMRRNEFIETVFKETKKIIDSTYSIKKNKMI